MIEAKFTLQGDLLGLASEVSSLTSGTVTLDDNSTHEVKDGTTFLAVDTGDVYILYKERWYKL